MRYGMLAVAAAGAMAVAAPERAAAWQKPYVHLGQPGAMEALERERPEHFLKVEEVIRTAQVETCETLPKILKVRLDVDSAQCSTYQLLTSLPPKPHLTFSLDGITYGVFVPQLRLAPGKLVPAQGAR
jgi:hypothetical protein